MTVSAAVVGCDRVVATDAALGSSAGDAEPNADEYAPAGDACS